MCEKIKLLVRSTHVLGICLLVLVLLGMAHSPVSAAAGDETVPGSLALTPTFECLGVVVNYTSDNNQNNSAVLEYREAGGTWKTAPQMYADRSSRQYRGSIFWLTANTNYEVRVTFTDADGVSGTNPVTGTVKTRDDNPPSTGKSYYVAATGSDSNAGTEAAPFKTIQKAANTVAAGDIVYIKAGTYSGEADLSTPGSASNYITFKNYGSDVPVITNSFVITTSYIRIKGLTFQNTADSSIYLTGEDLPAGSVTGDIVEDCIFTNPDMTGGGSQGGIRIDYGAQNSLIQRNTITIEAGSLAEDRDGVTWWRAGGGHVFRDNYVASTSDKLWDGFGGGPEDVETTMNDCDFYRNTVIGAHDDGIQPEGGDVNVRVWSNQSASCLMGIACCPVLKGPLYVFRNTMFSPIIVPNTQLGDGGAMKMGDSSVGRIFLYHNTAYGITGIDGLFATNDGLANIVARNNIFVSGWYTIEFGHDHDGVNHDFDYDNLAHHNSDWLVKWVETRYEDVSSFYAATGQEKHGINVLDNKFSDQAGGDFHLQSSSPDIDKGVVLPGFNDASSPWPYSGSAPDIGAYEFINQPPVFNPINNRSATEGNLLQFTLSAIDPNNDSLTYTASNLPQGASFNPVTHTFSWTPAQGQAGTYNDINFQVSDGFQFDSETISITVNAQAPPAGGGDGGGVGGGGVVATEDKTITSLLGIIGQDGTVWDDIEALSVDVNLSLKIPKRTVARNRAGAFLSSISITTKKEPDPPGENQKIIGFAYELGLSSATFDPPITLSIKYDASKLPLGLLEKDLVIANWDSSSGQWIDLKSTVDSMAHIVVTKISHFSTYAVMAHTRPASFEVADLTITPSEIDSGKNVDIGVLINNSGDLSGSYKVNLMLDNVEVQTEEVTLAGGASQTAHFSVTSYSAGEHQANIGDLTARFTIKAPKVPAAFEVDSLNITPTEVRLGGSVNISVLVTNTGDLPGNYRAILRVNGVSVQTKEVFLDNGTSENIRFSITPDTTGQYQVDIGGLQGTYDVKASPVATEVSQLEISTFSVSPSYDTNTGKLVSARIVIQMNKPLETFPDARLMMKVLLDDKFLEEIPLLTLNQLQLNSMASDMEYIPSSGWAIGHYTLIVELSGGENVIPSIHQQRFTVTSESVKEALNWRILGMVGGVTLVIIAAATVIMLHHRKGVTHKSRQG